MADEIKVSARITVQKDTLKRDVNPGQQVIDMAGERYSAVVQDVGPDTPELLVVGGDVGTAGWAMLTHLDAANFVRVGVRGPQLATPAAPTVTPQGTTGATPYQYRVAALDAHGTTAASAIGVTATGNAALSGTNFNRITWAAIPNATGYAIYGREDGGTDELIATVGAVTQYDDTGAATPSGVYPEANGTGFAPFAKLYPGESFPVPLEDKSNYAKADPAGVLAAPAAPTVAPQGTAGATAYSYKVSAIDANGETVPSAAGATATGNAALSTTNFNRLTWAAVTGATGYKVYGRTSGSWLLIATLGDVLTYDDTGAVTPAGAAPVANTTGIVRVEYSVFER